MNGFFYRAGLRTRVLEAVFLLSIEKRNVDDRPYLRQRARLTTSFALGYISTQHGWWYLEEPGAEPSLHGVWKSNINVTIDDDPDKCNPLSGGWPFKGEYFGCRISKVSEKDMP